MVVHLISATAKVADMPPAQALEVLTVVKVAMAASKVISRTIKSSVRASILGLTL